MARVRYSTREVTFSLAEFKAMDYGQVCEHLGLRPSKPTASAAKLKRQAERVREEAKRR